MAGTEVPNYCVCIECHYSMPAPKGIDCRMIKCPKCGGMMRPGNPDYSPLK